MKTKKLQVIEFVESHPNCTAKEIVEATNVTSSSLSYFDSNLFKPTRTDPRHLKPIYITPRKKQFVVTTEPVHIDHTGWVLDYIPEHHYQYQFAQQQLHSQFNL